FVLSRLRSVFKLRRSDMANVQTETPAVSAPPRRRPLFLAGILIFLLGIGLYFIQLKMRSFMVPWYVPILATVGVGLMVLSPRHPTDHRVDPVCRAVRLRVVLPARGYEDARLHRTRSTRRQASALCGHACRRHVLHERRPGEGRAERSGL